MRMNVYKEERQDGPMRTSRLHNQTPDVMSVSFDGSRDGELYVCRVLLINAVPDP